MERESCKCKNVRIVEEVFGQIPSENVEATETSTSSDDTTAAASSTKVKSYRMSNSYGTEVIVITWGATIVSIKCLDKYGQPADILLGFDNLDSYLDPKLSQMMGCAVGRCASASGEDEATTSAAAAHAGLQPSSWSFGRRLWEAHVEDECRVVMTYLSPDGEDGYPGALLATVKFELTDRSNALQIAMRAVASKPTTVNLSHSCIFNLAGHASGPDELRAHEICLNCDRWIQQQQQQQSDVEADCNQCKTKTSAIAIRRVGGTVMDLRVPRTLGQLIDELADEASHPHYLAISRGTTAASLQPTMCFASRILHRKSGRFLEVYSDQPGLELCAGGRLLATADDQLRERHHPLGSSSSSSSSASAGADGTCLNAAACDCDSSRRSTSTASLAVNEPALEFLPGKCGAKYERFGGFNLLPRNRLTSAKFRSPLFPSATLRPGQVYYHDLLYKFGVDLDNDCPY